MEPIILGSQSPRRKEIMSYFSLPFIQVTPPYEEEPDHYKGNPGEYAQFLSRGKAQSLLPRYPHNLILTADTVVFCEGKIYEKPRNKEEGFRALSELSNKWHTVYTALTLRKGKDEYLGIEETRVLFNALSPEHIHAYQHQLHCEDKAGGYAIQHAGAIVAKKIDGCFYNVMGLPINTLKNLLAKVEIDIWQHLRASPSV